VAKKESYWVARADERMALAHKDSDQTIQEINKAYDNAIKSIKDDINNIFTNFSISEGMDKAKAMELLNERVSQKTINDIRAKVKLLEDGEVKRKLINKLNAQAYKARITRLEALKESTYINSKQIADIELRKNTNQYFKTIKDTYYRNIFDSQKAVGYVFDFAKIPDKQIEEILKNNWSGKHYSSRIWDNSDVFASKLENIITGGMMSGKNSIRMAKELAEYADVGKFVSERLIRTETTYVVNMADLEGSKARGTKRIMFKATLDSRTSKECQEHDGNIIEVDKAAPGENIPPLHCFCRSCTIDIIEGLEHKTRLARDPATGKNYKVPADMKYDDWHKRFVESDPKAVLAEKKARNLNADQKQYDNYKDILGKEYLPTSRDDFQNIKYGDDNEYAIIKTQVKGLGYYNQAVMNEPIITEQVKKVAEISGMDMAGLKYRIKGKDTYLDKIRRKYKPSDNEYEIKDIIRYTYTAGPEELVDKTLKSIDIHSKLDYNTIEIKNYWVKKFNPYNGINTIVSTPNGQKFELQYHTLESYKIKDKIHDMYEDWRILPEGSERAKELNRKMFDSYKGVIIPKDIERVK